MNSLNVDLVIVCIPLVIFVRMEIVKIIVSIAIVVFTIIALNVVHMVIALHVLIE